MNPSKPGLFDFQGWDHDSIDVNFPVSQAFVAQLDSALASEAEGCGFEPRRAHYID